MVSLDGVAEELRALRRKTFGELDDRDLTARLPLLAAAARHVHGQAGDQPAPIRRLLAEAAGHVVPSELRPAVADLFGLGNDTFGRTLAYRQSVATSRFSPPPAESTFRQAPQYTRRIVLALAAAVLELSAGATQRELRTAASEELVDRTTLVDDAVALLSDKGMVWLWGEPGTGKTVLADQIADRLRPPRPVVRIRLSNSRVTEDDLLRAIGDEEADEAVRRARFRRLLRAGDAVGLVIIDDAAHPRDLALLGIDDAAVPVVVTSRVDAPDLPALHVSGLSPDEASAATRAVLPALSDDDTARLVTLSGGRPLVISHMAHHLRTTDATATMVLDGLAMDAARTIAALETMLDTTTDSGLTVTYRRMLDAFGADSDVVAVLDCLIWVSEGGLVDQRLMRDFLSWRFPGPVGDVLVSSAQVVLARHGIHTIDERAYTMHALTVDILRRLRAHTMRDVLGGFLDFLLATPETYPRRTSRAVMWLELVSTADLWPGTLIPLDAETWVHRRADGAVTRYKVADKGVFGQTDGEDSRPVTGAELDLLVEHIRDYWERSYWIGSYTPTLDSLAEEDDGLAHGRRLDPHSDTPLGVTPCGRQWLLGYQDKSRSRCSRCERESFDAIAAWRATGEHTTARRLLRDVTAAMDADNLAGATAARARLAEFVERTGRLRFGAPDLLEKLATADESLASRVRTTDPIYALELRRHALLAWEERAYRRGVPDRIAALTALGWAHHGVADLLDDPAEAKAALGKAVEVHRGARKLAPEDDNVATALGFALAHLSIRREGAEALTLMDEAIGLHCEVLARTPSSGTRRFLADALSARVDLLRDDNPPAARDTAEEAAHHYRLLLADEPDDLVVLDKLAYQLFRVADADARDQSTAALDRWADIVALQRRLFAAEAAKARHNLGVALTKYVHALHSGIAPDLAAELHAEAVAVLANLPGDDVRVLHEASRVLAYLASSDLPTRASAAVAAAGLLRRCLEREPDHWLLHRDLGRVLNSHAVALSATDPATATVLTEEATARFQRSLELNPDQPDLRADLPDGR